jgi:phage pi2 protein 07
MQVKNQWENAKLIMLNNKVSIDNGSWVFYSISNKTKVTLIIVVGDCYCFGYIDTEFSKTFYKYSI